MTKIRTISFGRAVLFALAAAAVSSPVPLDAGQATPKAPQAKASSPPAASSKTAKPKATSTSYSASASKARKATLTRARARSRARVVREVPIPRFKIDAAGEIVPDMRAAAGIIYNPDTGEVLWEEHSQDQRSIASITKVMTALVFLESDPDLNQEVVIDRSDTARASTTYLRAKDRLSVNDLLHLALVASDNAAARALARLSPLGPEMFIVRMNEKAREMGLSSTSYMDPSGLYADNKSSAFDMARLIAYAAGDDRISAVMRKPQHLVATSRRRFYISNTNALVRRPDMEVRGGKTGFISQSGYCLATLLRLPDFDQNVAVVILGARSNNGRFLEARNLFNWLSLKAHALFSRRDEPQ